ncbi:polysaccharide deacetylase [Paenibacillus hexagrammi]|uniref:Polysaccharide deacetylase n=1 Tax=Paenibacillus hexagrammi TaxID=2908839 RepID=A0ABY3SGZ3_9BACL|nr:polysaccharide deacetylase [Paenibacillus sp. YPD9-1]UJF32758.1 polysaccharide deacetylase [Paenibacillus sp. YPD9-1]
MHAHSSSWRSKYRKSIQILMAVLLVVYLWFPAGPAYADESAEASNAAMKQQEDVYQQLKTGKRVEQQQEYTAPEQPTVYLTFDDGPSKLTGQVLDILKENDIKATFFELGEEAKAYPDFVKRVVDEGHTLGNHTYNHVYKQLYGDFQTFWDQIQTSEDIFQDVAGVRPKFVRAPGGTYTNFDAFYYYFLNQAGYTVVDWNVDSGDSKRQNVPVNEIIHEVEQAPLKHEITVLFHDGTGHEESVKALPEVISYYKKHGYVFAPLTANVKPEQFHVGKSKWTRSMSEAHFMDLLKETQNYVLAHTPKPDPTEQNAMQMLQEQSEVAREESTEALAGQEAAVPLEIWLGQGECMVLGNDQYELENGRIELPIRTLIEKLGGQVEWEADTRTAKIHYGKKDMEYDIPLKTIRIYTWGKETGRYPLADMKLEDGVIQVPLRKTIELLGGQITEAVMDSRQREVSLSFRKSFLFPRT